MKVAEMPPGAELSPTVEWSRRVRRVGGFIQLAFAAFWLVRGSLNIAGGTGAVLASAFGVAAVLILGYGVRVTADAAPRPTSPEAGRIERAVTVATVVEFVAAFILPVVVIAAGHSDWVLPSIAITIGPLLLFLDHLVQIRRYRPVGWALTVGPVLLVATLSGNTLAATTGIAAGLLLLGIAAAGFHDLSVLRRPGSPSSAG